MYLTPGQEMALFTDRPDLWACEKVLKYCKSAPMRQIRKQVWDLLPPEDRSLLLSLKEPVK